MWLVSYQGRGEGVLTETGQMESTKGGGITSPTDAIPDALVRLPPELTTSYAPYRSNDPSVWAAHHLTCDDTSVAYEAASPPLLMGAPCKSLGLSNLIIGGLVVSRISFGGPVNADRVLLLQDVSDLLLCILVAEPIMVGVRVDYNAPPWSGALSVVDAAVWAEGRSSP